MTSNKSAKAKGSNLAKMTTEMIRNNHGFRAEYLKRTLWEKDHRLLAVRLRNLVDALGGVGKLSKSSSADYKYMKWIFSKPSLKQKAKIRGGVAAMKSGKVKTISSKNLIKHLKKN